MTEIKHIVDLITPILGDDKNYIEAKIRRFTSPGDNCGSLLLGVDILVKNKEGEIEEIKAVAKLLPQNEYIQKIFNIQYTFRNEVGFYETIALALKNFQKEHGIKQVYDCFPSYFGARISLDPKSNVVDQDAVLLIKNVKDEGFINVDRTYGFDLEQTKLILQKMAELHATFMAFKSQKPDFFATNVSRFFQKFSVFDFGQDNAAVDGLLESLIDLIKDDEFCENHIDKIRDLISPCCRQSRILNKNELDNPFLSFTHNDMWVNNVMIKMEDNRAVDVKFLDYQIYEISYLTRDVIFFLFTSVHFPVISKYCDELLQFYHENLIQWLHKFKHDCSKLSFEAFIENIKTSLNRGEFYHIMVMMGPIYAKNEHSRDVEEMNEEGILQQRSGVTQQCKDKARFIVREFITRGWI